MLRREILPTKIDDEKSHDDSTIKDGSILTALPLDNLDDGLGDSQRVGSIQETSMSRFHSLFLCPHVFQGKVSDRDEAI